MMRTLSGFLNDETRLMGVMGTIGAREVRTRLRHAADSAERLSAMKSSDRIGILQRLVARITVQADKLEIVVRAAGLWAAGDAQASDESMILIEVPVELKRCGMAVRLIARIPGESRMTRPDPKLAAIVAKAHDWFARLSSGRRDSVGAIAREERVTSSYVTRVVHLAFLAPDIVQRILRGIIRRSSMQNASSA